MIDALCIASSNPGKLEEIQAMLSGFSFAVHSQADFNIAPAVEIGSTFVENAIIKARHTAQLSYLPTIADDSGLCIDILNQAPGINSSDYAGKKATTKDNIQKVITSIMSYKNMTVKAHFVTAICFMHSAADLAPFLITEILEGELLHEPRGQTRGYDSIFFYQNLVKLWENYQYMRKIKSARVAVPL